VDDNPTAVEKIRRLFNVYDVDGDKCLTRTEIYNVITRNTSDGRTFNISMYSQFVLFFDFDKVDKDGNEVIDFDEFYDALLPNETANVFNAFDRKMRGHICASKWLPQMLDEFELQKRHLAGYDAFYASMLQELDTRDTITKPEFLMVTRRIAAFIHQAEKKAVQLASDAKATDAAQEAARKKAEQLELAAIKAKKKKKKKKTPKKDGKDNEEKAENVAQNFEDYAKT